MSQTPLLPWRTDRGPNALTDIGVLEWVSTNGKSSPRQISEQRRRESEIRLQCRYLTRIGLLRDIGNESFRLTDQGREALTGETELPSSGGYFDLSATLSVPEQRISATSALSQVKIKKRNSEFYDRATDPAADVDEDYSVDVRDARRERRVVWSVKKWKLDRLLDEFPLTEAAASQCAHWMRTISGLHLFPDANHRTGMTTLWMLAADNDLIDERHPWPGTPEEIGKAVLLSKFYRYLSSDVTLSTLWRKDALYWHWYQYFDYLLNGAGYPALRKHSEARLRNKLQEIRRRE